MGLDEVTQICPVPLPFWLSDSGGKGIQVVAVVHGEAQLAGRWGDYGRQVVLDTSSVKVFLPGITDASTLQTASTLCGQASWKLRGQDHATRHDVATPDMIRQLPAGFALVIRGGCAPVIARLPRAWKNPAYRRARRLGQARPRELAAEAEWPQPDIPDYVPAEWIPGDGMLLPLELTMTGNDPITGLLDQLAAQAEQVTRLDTREAEHHAALSGQLTELAGQAAGISRNAAGLRGRPDPAHRNQRSRSGSRRVPSRPGAAMVEAGSRRAARSRSPGCAPGWSRSTGPATGTWPPASAPAGPPTTCACTRSTSWPNCGRCCTSNPAAAPGWCRPKPNTRPASCPPWPNSCGSRPTAAATPAAPHRPAASPGARHDRARLRQALAYADRGWPVFPCQAGQKTPATRHGYRDATTDPEQITAWFSRNPRWNVAIATGEPGPDVLDVDEHGPAGNGYAAFARLNRAGLLDGAAAYVRTPSGGLHAYFRGSAQRNGHLPAHHLDFRSRGGYVLAPPSSGRRQALPAHPGTAGRRRTGLGHGHRPAGTAAADPAAPAAPRPRS